MCTTSKVLLYTASTAVFTFISSNVLAGEDFSLIPHSFVQTDKIQKVAAAHFLPDLEDSELGFGGEVITIDDSDGGYGQKDTCSGYNYTSNGANGTTKCEAPKSLLNHCSFDSSRYKNCVCNSAKFKYTSSNCVYVNTTSPAPNRLLTGTYCSDGSVNGYDACGCTSTAFPYTSNTSCGSNKELDTSSYCYTASDSTRRYNKCVCKDEFSLTSSLKSSDGWSCSSCYDGTTKYKCSATACPTGTSIAPTCLASEKIEETTYMSGGLKCKQCKTTVVDGCSQNNFKNIDGTYNVSPTQCSINLYGQYNTTNIPSDGITLWEAGWTYPSGATVNGGPLVVNNKIYIGIHGGQTTSKTTFNVPVIVYGYVDLYQDSSVVFNKGIGGDFKCRRIKGSTTTNITCPFTCTQNNYKNLDGAYTVSSSQCSINLYGQSNTTTIPSSGVTVDSAGWTYPSGATINGGSLTTNYLYLGVHGGQTTTHATFNVPVTVYGKITLYQNSSVTFNKGISGIYKCYREKGSTKTEITCPF